MATIRAIYLQAMDVPAEERPAFLDAACSGDTQLRARVEELLMVKVPADETFLSAPILPRSSTRLNILALGAQPKNSAELPNAIGPYRLTRKLGEGGMGVVFLAEQDEPVKRRVAVKIMHAGIGSRDTITRFEAERQTLARMDHPNIARVLDAGTTPGGGQYFVMEFVDGVPLNTYCGARALPLRERLALMLDVCHAIHHAHQKGIIHRDIKPSNLLVAESDSKPVVKVIDFGVAKAVGESMTDDRLATQYGSVIGTLEYMSPEQAMPSKGAADPQAPGIDIRSDVYSLGVVLYELLTGSTPLGRERVREMELLEVLRSIREDDPPRPSERIEASGDSVLPARAIRGELDWIAMRALEKDRTRRYGSALEFARDIERYLKDEAVEACPPSTWYRAGKSIRRHKWPFIAAAALALALVASAVLSSLLFFQEHKARQAAVAGELEQAKLRASADSARIAADSARVSAEESAQSLKIESMKNGRMAQFLTSVLENIPVENIERDRPLVRRMLENARKQIDSELANQPEVAVNLQQIIAKIYIHMADYARAETVLTRAIETRRGLPGDHTVDLARDLYYYATAMQVRDVRAAYATMRSAYELQRTAAPGDPLIGKMLGHLSVFSTGLHEFEEAQKYLELELASTDRANVGNRISILARYARLSTEYPKCAPELRRLLAELRKDMDTDYRSEGTGIFAALAGIYKELGDENETLAFGIKELNFTRKFFGPDHNATGTCAFKIGCVSVSYGRFDEGFKLMREGLAIIRKHEGNSSPAMRERVKVMSDALKSRGDALLASGDFDLASDYYSEALALSEKTFPINWDISTLRAALGEVLLKQRKFSEARLLLEKAYGEMADSAESKMDSNKAAMQRVAANLANAKKKK